MNITYATCMALFLLSHMTISFCAGSDKKLRNISLGRMQAVLQSKMSNNSPVCKDLSLRPKLEIPQKSRVSDPSWNQFASPAKEPLFFSYPKESGSRVYQKFCRNK